MMNLNSLKGSLMITLIFKLWNMTTLSQFKLWHLLAMAEIKQTFKRSILGTLWHSLGTGIAILGIGPLYATIFKVEIGEYFVFIAVSLIIWNYVQGTITEATAVFSGHESFIKDLNIKDHIFIYKIVWKNTIIFFQNVIMVAVIFLFLGEIERYHPWKFILIVPLMFFLLANIAMLVALLSTRFRDVAQIVKSGMQVLFFITPILWKPGRDMSDNGLAILLNPMYYMINVPRQLALGDEIKISHLYLLIIFLLASFLLSEFFYRKHAKKVVFWI